ncbi:phage integrase family domain-containing protein [Phthorimaea operculella]|nr:phage integrase family domain-containing protein [Phthorimaea operculella]
MFVLPDVVVFVRVKKVANKFYGFFFAFRGNFFFFEGYTKSPNDPMDPDVRVFQLPTASSRPLTWLCNDNDRRLSYPLYCEEEQSSPIDIIDIDKSVIEGEAHHLNFSYFGIIVTAHVRPHDKLHPISLVTENCVTPWIITARRRGRHGAVPWHDTTSCRATACTVTFHGAGAVPETATGTAGLTCPSEARNHLTCGQSGGSACNVLTRLGTNSQSDKYQLYFFEASTNSVIGFLSQLFQEGAQYGTLNSWTSQPVLVLPVFSEKPQICPVSTLKTYINKTEVLRDNNNYSLFISLRRPHAPVTSQTLGRWVKDTLLSSGVDVSKFTAHSTRHASTSMAHSLGVSVDIIRKTAGWTGSSNTFGKFYNRIILDSETNNSFATSILRNC